MDSNSSSMQQDDSHSPASTNQGAATPSTNNQDSPSDANSTIQQDSKKKRTGPKRRKVTHACVYCRRSHMTCDEGRPCQRCIKRSIGHLCHDEPKHSNNALQNNNPPTPKNRVTQPSTSQNYMPLNNMANGLGGNSNLGGLPIQFFGQMGTGQLTFASEHMGNEISVIR
ncbi:hypothetical protein BX666DRAFT_803792 [Dichotomocladium elegans]|nr:hypothetical protein BX666DRAFT_803792 [Dichotomocladium elegans]